MNIATFKISVPAAWNEDFARAYGEMLICDAIERVCAPSPLFEPTREILAAHQKAKNNALRAHLRCKRKYGRRQLPLPLP